MALSTYAGLVASVADFLHRTDLTAVIPDFVVLAEAQMNRRLRVRPMVQRATATITDEYSAAPSDFLAERTMALGPSPASASDPPVPLIFVTQEVMDEIAANQTSTAKPTHYTVVGSEFRYFPSPDTSYVATFTYFRTLPALVSNSTNWLLAACPDAYLYGALTQAAPYLIDDARLATWSALYVNAIDDINQSLGERRGSRLRPDAALSRPRRFNIYAGA